ncbi:MAG: palindromic element RPE4 domain-containing protein, partial [Gammaproteobacteria bacterium]|nr:palindromic element RPE4 domain-containing protein [Gammaproteobacteria bacterium]
SRDLIAGSSINLDSMAKPRNDIVLRLPR